MSREEISHMIKMFRKEQGLTQAELAEKAHVSLTRLRDIEQNRCNASEDTLEKIADALGLKLTMVMK